MVTNIKLDNVSIAYKYKSDSELKLTFLIFKLLKSSSLLTVLKATATYIIKYNLPLNFLIRKTIFKLFCAGETIDEAFVVIKKLESFKVNAVLDYVSEGEKSSSTFESNASKIVSNIFRLAEETSGNYISVKISGLEDVDFLTKINGLKKPWLTADELRYNKLLDCLRFICSTAKQNNVQIYFDAEDRCMQDIIDVMVENMMEKYNTEKVVVFNTLQMYLKDRIKFLNDCIHRANQNHFFLGIKLVRGAYVEKERERAIQLGIDSPVFDTKEQTDNSFNEAVDICLKNHKLITTCIASHNYYSTVLAIHLINKYNISNPNKVVMFSQLYGMSDVLTFNLADKGYAVSKYLPYGEVKKAIPYLIRRSEENTAINSQLDDELKRLKEEINNRKNKN